MAELDPKFEGASEQELEEYVEGSHQRPGESDDAWAARVRGDEADLVRKLALRREAQAGTLGGEVEVPAE